MKNFMERYRNSSDKYFKKNDKYRIINVCVKI